MRFQPTFVAILIVAYVLVFEFLFFFFPELTVISYVVKFLFPILIITFGIQSGSPFKALSPQAFKFSLLYAALLLTVLIPTIATMGPAEGFLEWGKHIPRLIFFIAVVAAFTSFPKLAWLTLRFLVVIAVISVFQYILLVYDMHFGNFELTPIFDDKIVLGGPYGLGGNFNARMYFPSFDLPIPRLTGFWLEPSNASGFMFASFFFARALSVAGFGRKWKGFAAICLCGGFACLSNAGYLALGSAFFFPYAMTYNPNRTLLTKIAFLAIGCALIIFAITGRSYVANNMTDNDFARAVTGVRQLESNPNNYDSSGGRLSMLSEAFDLAFEKPFGVGLITDVDTLNVPSAPIKWLATGGIIALIFILLRERALFQTALQATASNKSLQLITQAWVVLLMQQLSYGEWANGLYLVTAAFIFASITWKVHYPSTQLQSQSIPSTAAVKGWPKNRPIPV